MCRILIGLIRDSLFSAILPLEICTLNWFWVYRAKWSCVVYSKSRYLLQFILISAHNLTQFNWLCKVVWSRENWLQTNNRYDTNMITSKTPWICDMKWQNCYFVDLFGSQKHLTRMVQMVITDCLLHNYHQDRAKKSWIHKP